MNFANERRSYNHKNRWTQIFDSRIGPINRITKNSNNTGNVSSVVSWNIAQIELNNSPWFIRIWTATHFCIATTIIWKVLKCKKLVAPPQVLNALSIQQQNKVMLHTSFFYLIYSLIFGSQKWKMNLDWAWKQCWNLDSLKHWDMLINQAKNTNEILFTFTLSKTKSGLPIAFNLFWNVNCIIINIIIKYCEYGHITISLIP